MIKSFYIRISYIQTNRTKLQSPGALNIQETPGYNQKDNVKKIMLRTKKNK